MSSTLDSVEKKISKNSYESGVIVDKNGFVLAAYKGDSVSVNFTDGKVNDHNKIKGNIVTHNHPQGGTVFSQGDLELTAKYKGREIRVATGSGARASLRVNSNRPKWDKLIAQYDSFLKKRRTVKQAQDWFKKNASKHGFVFKLTK